jgi:hypothetical protein
VPVRTVPRTTIITITVSVVNGSGSLSSAIPVEWKNEGNCENGIDSVNGENGAIELIKASIC